MTDVTSSPGISSSAAVTFAKNTVTGNSAAQPSSFEKTDQGSLTQNQTSKTESENTTSFQSASASPFSTNQTFRVVGSAPEFQVISAGGNVYLSHSSGYLLSLAPGLDRSFIRFNDQESPLKEIVGAEPDTLQQTPAIAYSRSGTPERELLPSGILQNITA